MFDPPSLDAIMELLSIFKMPPFFLTILLCWIHGSTSTLLEPKNCSTLLELENYSIKEQLNFLFFFGTKELLHFARTMAGTRELLSFFEINELHYFCWIHVWNEGTTQFFFFYIYWNQGSSLESRISSALLGSRIS